MKYKINNAYIIINGEHIPVGTVLGKEGDPQSPFTSEIIPNSEYEKGLKCFKYGKQQIGDCVFHCICEFVGFTAENPIEQKWIDELKKMGYDTSVLKYEIKH